MGVGAQHLEPSIGKGINPINKICHSGAPLISPQRISVFLILLTQLGFINWVGIYLYITGKSI